MMGFIFGWRYLESKSVWLPVIMHSCNNLVSLNLLREAHTLHVDPTLRQSALFAVIPIALVWAVMLTLGAWRSGAEVRKNRLMLRG